MTFSTLLIPSKTVHFTTLPMAVMRVLTMAFSYKLPWKYFAHDWQNIIIIKLMSISTISGWNNVVIIIGDVSWTWLNTCMIYECYVSAAGTGYEIAVLPYFSVGKYLGTSICVHVLWRIFKFSPCTSIAVSALKLWWASNGAYVHSDNFSGISWFQKLFKYANK